MLYYKANGRKEINPKKVEEILPGDSTPPVAEAAEPPAAVPAQSS